MEAVDKFGFFELLFFEIDSEEAIFVFKVKVYILFMVL
jgi:hypothetical protein